MVKAIFFDIDGTLVSFETHTMPDSTRQALFKLREQGIKLFIATGRHKSMIEFMKQYFVFDGYISLNGQYCYTTDTVVYKNSIDKADMAVFAKQAREKLYTCYFIEEDRMYINQIDEVVKATSKHTDTELPQLWDGKGELENDIFQVNVFLKKEEEHLIHDNMKNVTLTRWHKNFADVVPKGGSKQIGITHMLEHFGISRDETMAFGDGENDIEMLQFVKTGIAMGNASDEVKSHADYITAAVNEDGITKALQHFEVI